MYEDDDTEDALDGTEGGILSSMTTPTGGASKSSPGIEAMRKAGTTLIGDPSLFVSSRDKAASDYSNRIDEAIRRLRMPESGVNIPLLKIAGSFLSPTKTGTFGESLGRAMDVGSDALYRSKVDEDKRQSSADNLEISKAQFNMQDTNERMRLGQSLLAAAENADARRLRSNTGPLATITEVLKQQGIKEGSPEWQRALRAYGNKLIYGTPPRVAPRFELINLDETDEKGNRTTALYRVNLNTGDKTKIGSQNNLNASATPQLAGNSVTDLYGLPKLDSDPFADITDPKQRNQAIMQSDRLSAAALKEESKNIRYSPDMVDDLTRAESLINEIGTGSFGGPMGWVNSTFPNFSSKISELNTIVNKMTPSMRVPGSGSTSDFDAKMFKGSLFGLDKPKDTNLNVVLGMKAQVQRNGEYKDFLENYASVHHTLRGAKQAWKRYVEDNPIFDRSSNDTKVILNKDRMSYQDYFRSGGRKPIELKD